MSQCKGAATAAASCNTILQSRGLPGRSQTAIGRPFQPLPRQSCRATQDDGGNSQLSQEKFIDTRSLVREAMHKSPNFVFEYDSADDDEAAGPASLFEQRMAAQAEAGAIDQSGARGDAPAAAETVDILSAYSPDQGFKEVSVEELAELRADPADGTYLLDVRTTEEFGDDFNFTTSSLVDTTYLLDIWTTEELRAERLQPGYGHAEGAVNLPLDQLTDAVRGGRLPSKEVPIAIICQSGRRSAQAAVKLMRVHGFGNVVNVKGGTLAWMAAGLPTES